MSKTDSLLAEAVGLHQAGRTAEAAEIYEKVLAQTPNHFDATHLLGVIALQEGRLDLARELISAALRVKPKDSAALGNLGTAHLRQGRSDLAYEQFERAAKLQPNSFGALTNLGTALRQLGRPREAVGPLRRALAIDSKSAMVCNLIGACLLDIGDPHGAVHYFETATGIEPNDPGGWGNLSIALNSTGEHQRAAELAAKAVAMNPTSSAAVAAMAAAQFEQGRIEDAVATYREAVSLAESSTQTHTAFANALWTSGRCEEAFDELRRALALDGNNLIARWKLAMSQCQPFYDTAAAIEASRRIFAERLGELDSWLDASNRPEAFSAVGSTQPFFIAYQPFNNKDLLSRYGQVCARFMSSMPLGPVKSQPRLAADRKLRIGIASAHIRDHSVWNAITRGWVQHLDKSRFELWLFQLGRAADEETVRARQGAAHFETGPKTLSAWAEIIRDARLDALIYPEIGMDALTTQLASLRLAGVQAATWGHPETTGLPTIDLYLSADALELTDAELNYSETLVRLPNLGVCVEPLTPPVATLDLKSLGLPDDEPLLLCPGTPFKYSPAHDRVWARIAKGLGRRESRGTWANFTAPWRKSNVGKLVFFRGGNESMESLLMQRLRRAFDAEQVDFDAHVRLIPYLDRPRWFALMRHAALMLDTLGFSGFNNTLQAVEAGLPVLAREGNFMRSRLASSIMRRMELPELVATTDEAFVQMAVDLAADHDRRHALRKTMETRRSILFNDLEPVRALEIRLSEAIGAVQTKL